MNKTIGALLLIPFVHVLLLSMALAQNGASKETTQKITETGIQEKGRSFEIRIDDPAYRENANDDLETKLTKEKIRAALMEIGDKRKSVDSGQDQVIFLFETQKRLIAALLEFHKEPAIAISILETNLEMARQIETNRRLRAENGIGRPDEHAIAIYFRADAELQLLRAKNKNK